jgi:DNA-binding NarL/FixJ family response regulator
MLDLSLPDRDGIEFLSVLKDIGFNGKLIVMSSQPRNVIDMAATLATAQGIAPSLTSASPSHLKSLQRSMLFWPVSVICRQLA